MSVLLVRGDSPQTAPVFFALQAPVGHYWTEDARQALQFGREQDATAFAKVYLKATPCRTAPSPR